LASIEFRRFDVPGRCGSRRAFVRLSERTLKSLRESLTEAL
jgi:hypothetical protein